MKQLNIIGILFLVLATSCSSSSRNMESDESANDSIVNVQLKSLVDSTLSHNICLHLDTFSIYDWHRFGDTIKWINGEGFSGLYKEILNVSGCYRFSHNVLTCISLIVSHQHVDNVFTIHDTITTNQLDTLSFAQQLHNYYVLQDELLEERKDLAGNAYANRTKVHFGISREEYNRLGEDFQRNFYEGLIGYGAYELAKPRFDRKGIFSGFEISEIHDKTFSYNNVQNNADLVEKRQHGYGAHETFFWVYVCELYNMQIMSRYDKFERRTKNSLKCYWNKYIHMYNH